MGVTMLYFYYDYTCPYSYLVSERLNRLEREYGERIERRGIILQTHVPKEGIPLSPEKEVEIRREIEDVRQLGNGELVELRLPAVDLNTYNAIAATVISGRFGFEWEFHREIYRAYWHGGKNIGNITVLAELADQIGMDATELVHLIQADQTASKIRSHRADFRKLGIRGVPTIDFDGRIVKGVQSYNDYKTLYLDALWDQEVYDCSCE